MFAFTFSNTGGHDGQSYLNSIERYDPQTNQWSSDVALTSTCRTSVGVAVLDGFMYAVGGQDGVSCLNVVERYDPQVSIFIVHVNEGFPLVERIEGKLVMRI